MYRLKKLPYKKDYITVDIYRFLSNANYTLGELKGVLDSTPYLEVILRLLNIYEAKTSSEIEGVKSSFEDVFLQSVTSLKKNPHTNEVINHLRAINIIYRDILTKNKLYLEDINRIQELIAPEQKGIRRIRGHKIYNKLTNKVIYIPPQNQNAILDYLENLLEYINLNHDRYDPLIRMAIIHYQFECIHPYRDGNGRIGRIINSMSLVLSRRLNYPILNLSSYLNNTKETYFKLLEKCHNDINYLDEFIIYMLKGINETGKFTVTFINQITRLINNYKQEMLSKLPKIYSERLLVHLFKYPYTKNELLRIELNTSRTTSTKYLKLLEEAGFIESFKYGKEVVYKNTQLINIFL
ncbi:Adenosine monophosphate-protein transferase SoFic [Candidatus Izimaplasma bacterium HR1]|jgi:Fic family protein|uniref:Fic family protein n=1 Tax=Candidatus Izimoplasma sp. HR1 TaxID=1541959 RepID=UPI0004F66C02|nr:Adenosine monophosphate-protein transferase SoFic [Candidatus Izimaplasma bacterium HR1]